MSGKYQAYPEYKDSGVEWLGKIPEHWMLKRVQEAATLTNGFPFDSKKFHPDMGIPLVRIRDINTQQTAVHFDGEAPQEALIDTGDVLIGMDGDFNVAMWKGGKAALNQRVACVRSEDKQFQKFLYYILPFNMKVVNDLTYFTTVKHLGSNDILKTAFSQPPAIEVKKIVAFLDHETAKIDTLIEEQQSLIRLLKEKRQAVISHAITKGLNPDAPMKNSGVEWLGEVPKHWLDTEIRYITHQIGGGTPSKDRLDFWNGNIPWVSPKDMKVDYLSDVQDKITDQAIQESSTKLIPVGSVLIVVRGMILVHSVPVALTQEPVTVNQDMKALVTDKGVDGEFLLFFMKGLKRFILDLVEESAHGTKCLRTEVFERMKITIPDLDEQIEIVKKLKGKLRVIDSLIDDAQQGVELFKERRTALISSAVTGKIDVRDWTPTAHPQQKHPEAIHEQTA